VSGSSGRGVRGGQFGDDQRVQVPAAARVPLQRCCSAGRRQRPSPCRSYHVQRHDDRPVPVLDVQHEVRRCQRHPAAAVLRLRDGHCRRSQTAA